MPRGLKQGFIVLAAALGYGGWAVYSNMPGQLGPTGPAEMMAEMSHVAWRAGFIQGGYAGLLTLINLAILERLFGHLRRRCTALQAAGLTLLVSTVAQYSIIIPVHLLNGTPNILITLLPGFVISTLFSSAYLWHVAQQ
ncbi:MAG: hypothetical protein KJP25_09450 [Gammaproteobacteria bacterium]|nr:hypothetical protein [Gammaproteobacteria bacterium]NND38840.1 hypothetical protein [Pseudomonadales bacterium]MBT8149885.1 hypothetical protein [Gammaproteobacteria bacterium]NNL11047.1 hypothetical protein [Pseudomonadales bacterium]NNM10411.1 hypothetical protein [Pseudomonadales bacterium]